jgi:hypothetical protein
MVKDFALVTNVVRTMSGYDITINNYKNARKFNKVYTVNGKSVVNW